MEFDPVAIAARCVDKLKDSDNEIQALPTSAQARMHLVIEREVRQAFATWLDHDTKVTVGKK